uniref:Odorant receptor n=1 Tax=Cyrtorhinus lividipennis TaxID=1032904 RepID=A0A346TI17_9HEMI|nr:odorant receptor 9 [Cyrtorhinus lividipennis]
MSGEIDKIYNAPMFTLPSPWQALDTADKKIALKKGYSVSGGWIMEFSGLYLGQAARPIIGFMVAITANFMMGSAAYFAFVLDHDLECASEGLHLLVMTSNMMWITMNFLWYRPIVDELYTAIGAGFFSYGDTIDEVTQKEMDNAISEMRKKKKVFMKVFGGIVMSCGSMLFVKCLVAYFRFGHRVDGEGGTVLRRQVVPVWFFGVDKWPGYLFACFMAYSMQAWNMLTIVGSVLPMIAFFEEMIAQLLLVGIGLRRLVRRAKHVLNTKYQSNDKILFQKCMEDSLKASIQHHIVVLEMCAKLKQLLMVPLMTIVFGSALLLCMQGYVIIEDTVPLLVKIASSVFLMAELIYTFLFSIYGETLTNASEDIGNQLYLANWIQFSNALRPYYAMIKFRCSRPVRISAGGFIVVDLKSFLNVLSTSYTYVNLMLSSRK